MWPAAHRAVDESSALTRRVGDACGRRWQVHCKTCQGHLGHVFEDGWAYNGAAPTGLRYCINGLSLAFNPVPGQPDAKPTTKMTEFGRVPI